MLAHLLSPFFVLLIPTLAILNTVYSLCLSMWYDLVLSGSYLPDSDPGLSLLSAVCQIIISTQGFSLCPLN